MWTPCDQGPGAVSPVLPPELQALGAGVKDDVGTAARGAPDCAHPAWAPGPLNVFSLSHGSGVDALLLPLPAVGAALAVEQHSLGRKARAQGCWRQPAGPEVACGDPPARCRGLCHLLPPQARSAPSRASALLLPRMPLLSHPPQADTTIPASSVSRLCAAYRSQCISSCAQTQVMCRGN